MIFSLFSKEKENKNDKNHLSLTGIAALLIHSARIDENFTEKENQAPGHIPANSTPNNHMPRGKGREPRVRLQCKLYGGHQRDRIRGWSWKLFH